MKSFFTLKDLESAAAEALARGEKSVTITELQSSQINYQLVDQFTRCLGPPDPGYVRGRDVSGHIYGVDIFVQPDIEPKERAAEEAAEK